MLGRSELGDARIPVSLVSPLGSADPDVSSDLNAASAHGSGGSGGAAVSLGDYARHSVSEMLEGAPYVLAPGSSNDRVRLGCGRTFGYNRLWPALAILQAFLLPLVSLRDTGVPAAWRERVLRCWVSLRGNATEAAAAQGFVPLQELEA